jgi:hypothetical protein
MSPALNPSFHSELKLKFPLPHILNTLTHSPGGIVDTIGQLGKSITQRIGAGGLVDGAAEALARGADDVADCAEEAAREVADCAVGGVRRIWRCDGMRRRKGRKGGN